MTAPTNLPLLRGALRTAEAATYLGVSVSLMRKWRLKGRDDSGDKGPPYAKVTPYVVLYKLADLDAWLNQHRAVA